MILRFQHIHPFNVISKINNDHPPILACTYNLPVVTLGRQNPTGCPSLKIDQESSVLPVVTIFAVPNLDGGVVAAADDASIGRVEVERPNEICVTLELPNRAASHGVIFIDDLII